MLVQDRRRHHILELVLGLLALVVAFELTLRFRVLLNPMVDRHFTPEQAGLSAPPLDVILVLWAAVVFRFRLYQSSHPVRFWNSALRVAECTVAATVVTVLVTFFSREFGGQTSRSFVILLIPVSFALLTVSRLLALAIAVRSERYWPPPVRIALIGNTRTAGRLVENLGPSQLNRSI